MNYNKNIDTEKFCDITTTTKYGKLQHKRRRGFFAMQLVFYELTTL
jgi:hypothetical protein